MRCLKANDEQGLPAAKDGTFVLLSSEVKRYMIAKELKRQNAMQHRTLRMMTISLVS